eukprot:2419574-Amphidinium_carterae.2
MQQLRATIAKHTERQFVSECCERSSESSLLLCDNKNAFGSMARPWILHCLRARGLQGPVLHFMIELLRPSSLFMRWRGETTRVINMVEGTPQGGPMSPWFFLVELDPLLRRLAAQQHPSELLSAWADDLAAVSVSFATLSMVFGAIAEFTLVSGLALQLQKYVLIPLGADSIEEWTAALYSWLPPAHGLRAIPIKMTA